MTEHKERGEKRVGTRERKKAPIVKEDNKIQENVFLFWPTGRQTDTVNKVKDRDGKEINEL